MLQNAYLLAKIGAHTAENEQHVAEILPKTGKLSEDGVDFTSPGPHRGVPAGRGPPRPGGTTQPSRSAAPGGAGSKQRRVSFFFFNGRMRFFGVSDHRTDTAKFDLQGFRNPNISDNN